MLIDSKQIVSMSEANRNFSQVVREAEEKGCIVIFKNNEPKLIVLDIASCRLELPKTDERIDKVAKRKVSQAKWL